MAWTLGANILRSGGEGNGKLSGFWKNQAVFNENQVVFRKIERFQ
jgi:hypothetical protein